MHEKFLDRLLPSYFNKSEMIDYYEKSNKGKKTYVVHNNDKLADESIEEHKMQEN